MRINCFIMFVIGVIFESQFLINNFDIPFTFYFWIETNVYISKNTFDSLDPFNLMTFIYPDSFNLGAPICHFSC